MATIETVNIESVKPLYDEYGNNMARRDYDLPENKAYVEELARSMAKKGVPDEMVTLIRHGNSFLIKAGNSRIEAMRLLGTKEFPAIIEDDDEAKERAIVETTIRTNVKKKYEAVEQSRFIQQLFLFANDQEAAEVTGIEVAKIAAARRASKVAGEKAETMSFDRLIAIDEFEDDEDAVEELTACVEDQWEDIASKHRKARERKKKYDSFMAKAEELGIPVVTKRAELAENLRYWTSGDDASILDRDIPEGTMAYDDGCTYNRFNLYIPYVPEESKSAEEIEAENAEKKRFDDLDAAWNRVKSSIRIWLADRLDKGIVPSWISESVESDEHRFSWGPIRNFITFLDDYEYGPLDIPCGMSEAIEFIQSLINRSDVSSKYSDEKDASNYISLLASLTSDRFTLDDDCKLLLARADELVAQAKDESEEDED